MPLVAPSMLSADFLHLEKDIDMVNRHADLFHLDIMDGVFVPNISYGFPVVEAMARKAEKPLDVHLMIVQPERYVERFAAAGADMLSFHLNATDDPSSVLAQIRRCGMKAGLVINPDLPVESLFPYVKECDFMMLMGVYAGFGGQKYIPETTARLRMLKDEILRQGADVSLEVDGGVTLGNIKEIADAGVDIAVAGSTVFKAEDPARVIEELRCR